MHKALQEASLTNLSCPPAMIWELVMADLHQLHPHSALHTILKNPSISIIKNMLAQATGNVVYHAVETVPTVNVANNDPRPFYPISVIHSVRGRLNHYLWFGHPDLVRLLRYRGALTRHSRWLQSPFHSALSLWSVIQALLCMCIT